MFMSLKIIAKLNKQMVQCRIHQKQEWSSMESSLNEFRDEIEMRFGQTTSKLFLEKNK